MRYDAADGHTYLTATAIRGQEGYADITAALLRGWVDAGHLPVVTVGEVAAVLGYPPPPDPDRPARIVGPSGPENVYRWADVVRCETARRQHQRARGGRPRRRDP